MTRSLEEDPPEAGTSTQSARSSVGHAVSAPIRTSADYADDSDDEEAYRSPQPTQSTGRKTHRTRPSASRLLEAVTGPDSPIAPWLAERQRKLRDYMDGEDVQDGELGWRRYWIKTQSLYTRTRSFVVLNQGFLLIAFAQMFFAGINTCVKLLQQTSEIAVWQLILVRMSVTWFGCYSYMRIAKVEHPLLGPPGVRLLLCLRGLIGFFGLFGMYYSLNYLSLSDSTVLSFLSPVLVGLLATVVLKESYSRKEAISAVLSLFGVLLISKPSFLFSTTSSETTGPRGDVVTPEQREMAVGASLMGVFGAAGAYLTIRLIGKRANALHSISYFSAYCCLVSSLYPLFVHSPPIFETSKSFLMLIVPIGIMGFIAQALLTIGLQREKAGRGTLAVYTNLLYALVLEFIVFHKLPDFLSFLGGIIIISGAVWVVLEKSSSSDSGNPRRASVVDHRKAEEGRLPLGQLSSPRESGEDTDDDEAKTLVLPGASGTGER